MSIWACAATGVPASMLPFTIPGGNPVILVPGERPRSPFSSVRPVLVTVDAPSTAKVLVVLSDTKRRFELYAGQNCESSLTIDWCCAFEVCESGVKVELPPLPAPAHPASNARIAPALNTEPKGVEVRIGFFLEFGMGRGARLRIGAYAILR